VYDFLNIGIIPVPIEPIYQHILQSINRNHIGNFLDACHFAISHVGLDEVIALPLVKFNISAYYIA
jgi:hypothetical protein